MPGKKSLLLILLCLALQGCPFEGDCDKVMQCEDDVEMVCGKNDAGCGEDCHYYVHEYCYEVCNDVL